MSQKKIKISSNDVSVTPSGKKLVQARLPFKSLASTPKVGIDSLATGDSRKRRLSTAEDDNRSVKLIKTGGAKENIIKTDEVTVLEMVDLVDDDDDIVMTTNDISSTAAVTKPVKKSVNGAEEKGTPLRRSNRKNDSEAPAKVVIKIPSSKKKKSNERQSKTTVVPKIDENDDDDDVIPFDSEENSLNSNDGREKGNAIEADNSVAMIVGDDSSPVAEEVSDSKVTDPKVVDAKVTDSESTDVQLADSSTMEVAQSGKVEQVSQTANEKVVLPEEKITTEMNHSIVVGMETSVEKISAEATESGPVIDDEENVSSASDENDREASIETDRKKEIKLAIETDDGASEEEAGKNGAAEMETDVQSKVSTPTSQRRTRKSIDNSTMNTPKTPIHKPSDGSTLTPKQLQKKLESEQKRLAKEKAKEERERKIQEAKEERERKLQEAKEERERKIQEAKEERERKLQEEKELRQRERDEKERQKKKERDDKEELKRKEREDKEEQRRKEKEEREKKRQAEIDAKNEEKRQKEEERVAREEAELKKKRKEAEAFTKFFAKKSNKSTENDKMDVDDEEVKLNFMPFRVKPDMRLAPIVRRTLSPTTKSKFDEEVLNSTQDCSTTDLYIHSIRNGSHVSERQGKTWANEENNEDDDLMIVDDLEGGTPIEETSAVQKYRAKFFKFEENRRPPYYGTWQKKSSVITPRRPFVTDQKHFDYEIDSDDEWEDEEPGESLHGSDDEKDKESDDDYDIDNEFFVPHGHLSDEELANNDEIDDDNTPDTQKAKLKIMQKVFSDEMKKKTEKIKPRLIGLIWQNRDGSQPTVCPNVIWEMLQVRSMIFNGPTIVMPADRSTEKIDAVDENGESKKGSTMKKRVKLTEEVVVDLLRLIHGNTNSIEFLSKEFRAFTAQKNKDNDKFQEFSLSSIRMKIKELAEWKACPEEGPLLNKYCWYVSNEQRKSYDMEDLTAVNEWQYTLTPKTKAKSESKKAKESDKVKSPPEATDEPTPTVKTPKSKLGNIEKFTKILSDDDKKKNFSIPVQLEPPIEMSSSKPKPLSDAEPSPKPVKKRVNLLMSVPRGQEIPVQTKNTLISQYLSSSSANNKKSTDNSE